MAEQLINNRIGSEKQFLFLNDERIVGVQSLAINPELGLSPNTHLGIGNGGNVFYVPTAEQSTSFSINSNLLNKDFFIFHVTGTELANAYILRSPSELSTCYSILSGYFTSYQCNYSIGNVPTISTSFIAFENAGVISTGSMTNDQVSDLEYISTGNHDITGLLVPYGNSVTLNIDEFTTNRVQAFSVGLNVTKVPVYKMGSKLPIRLDINEPIAVECSFSFEQGDYTPITQRNIPQNNVVKNLNLVIRDYNSDDIITTYTLNNLTLVSENLGVNVNNDVTIDQVYRGLIYA